MLAAVGRRVKATVYFAQTKEQMFGIKNTRLAIKIPKSI